MIRRIMTTPLILMVRAYQMVLRPLMPGNACRFHPTCSEYAIEALNRHGAWRGGLFSIRRILRCHPFARGGIDLVP